MRFFYVGIGKAKDRAYNRTGRTNFWKRIVKKHGYNIEIIAKGLSWEDAQELEIFLISEYGRRDLGLGNLVNMTDGGDGGFGRIHSEETKKKRSKLQKY